MTLPRVFTDLSRLSCEAVHLYQYLQNNPTVKNASVTLECIIEDESRLIIADTSRKAVDKLEDQMTSGELVRSYTDDTALMEVLRLESLYRSLDPLDRKIIALLREGGSNTTVVERLYISEGTVKYRIRSIAKACDLESRAVLAQHLRRHSGIGFD